MSAQSHHQAIGEMLRVVREVPLFPLPSLDGGPSPQADCGYALQMGGNEMLGRRQSAAAKLDHAWESPCAS